MTQAPAVPPPGDLLRQRLAKSDAGRDEIRQRTLPLSRPARNLLLIIDTGRPAGDWLGLVHGSTPDDLRTLLDAGLVLAQGEGVPPAPGATPGAARPAVPAPAPAAGQPPPGARMSLAQALETKGYQVLYDRLTAEARPRLGLIKGYKLILEIERCNGPAELRALALRTVEAVRQAQGEVAALALVDALLAPD